MKIFKFGFDGLWMGGYAHVLANNEEEAREMLITEIKKAEKSSFKKPYVQEWIDSIELDEICELDEPKITYYWDGDY